MIKTLLSAAIVALLAAVPAKASDTNTYYVRGYVCIVPAELHGCTGHTATPVPDVTIYIWDATATSAPTAQDDAYTTDEAGAFVGDGTFPVDGDMRIRAVLPDGTRQTLTLPWGTFPSFYVEFPVVQEEAVGGSASHIIYVPLMRIE